MSTRRHDREIDIPKHLERVSRSFAFCIARLDSPLRERVGLSYLICRLLDTVEDAAWVGDGENRRHSFETFIALMSRENLAEPNGAPLSVAEWAQDVLQGTRNIPQGEVLLLEDAELIFQELSRLPKEARDVLRPPIVSMARGMREFADQREAHAGRLTLSNLAEVNRYCFFVAGVVGELLDGLLQQEAARLGVELQTSLADSFRFGLFLQKVNLLKDRETDLKEGRDLVPEAPGSRTGGVIFSALGDARRALKYLVSIPVEFKSYRLFCAWSLFLGLASLVHIRKGQRLGRLETVALLARVERRIDSNERLTQLFDLKEEPIRQALEQDFQSLPKESRNLDVSTLVEAYRQHYTGQARDEDLIDVATAVS